MNKLNEPTSTLFDVIAGYLRHVWDKIDWLCEGKRGFRSGY